MSEISKQEIVELLREWIKQRPGLEFCNYGDVSSYRSEMTRITRQKHDAETLLRAVELSGMSVDEIKAGFRAFSGRLQLTETETGYRLDYCTGQYWPTEYRAAAAAVLASALWDYYREDTDNGDSIRAKFRRLFGKSIQRRWFD
jgi:ornithine cyclodeaminase/alanine dehydrogenase-like protein (mu-crystallin family)